MDEEIVFGRGKIEREGEDVAIFAVGNMVDVALDAAQQLEQEGISAMVINPRFVKPLDEELIAKAASIVSRFFTVEEHVLKGGFGDAMASLLQEKKMRHIQLVRVGIPDKFVKHAEREQLLEKFSLTSQTLTEKITDCFARSLLSKL